MGASRSRTRECVRNSVPRWPRAGAQRLGQQDNWLAAQGAHIGAPLPKLCDIRARPRLGEVDAQHRLLQERPPLLQELDVVAPDRPDRITPLAEAAAAVD